MAAKNVVSSLQREVELAREGLKNVDENIKKLTGRDPSESRGPAGNRRIVVKRNFGDRTGGPPQKRFATGNAYNRLGPRVNDRDKRRLGQLESDGEEEEDDGKKPTLQSSIVATPTPSRLEQTAKPDKKTQTRNKRMFGVLLGTLQKFKENSSKEAARERKRKQIEKKLEEAAVKEREESIRQKKELFLARREQQTKLEELERKIEVAELLEEWEDHDRKLSKFIRTNTKPHIFYLPAKHNDYTLGLLEKTSEHVEEEIKKRRQEIEDVLHKPRDDDEQEPGNESRGDNDDKQEVDHSDDEGHTRTKGVKVGRRQVILTGVRQNKEGLREDIGDEIGGTNEGKSAIDEEREESVEMSGKDEVEEVEGKEEVEAREVKENEMEEKEVEVKIETNETEVMREEKEGDVEISELNEEKIKGEGEEVEEVEENKGAKVETAELPEEKGGEIKEDVNEDLGLNRDLKVKPSKHEDNCEQPVVTGDITGMTGGDKEMDVVVQETKIQQSENQPEHDDTRNDSESHMYTDPEQDNIQ